MAVSLAIVRWDGDVRTFTPTVFTLSVGFSTLIYGGLFAVAPEAARLLGSPGATDMIRLMSVCVIIDGLICVPFALLTRTFAQRRLMLVNAINFIVTTGVTFWLAFSGSSAISFAWGAVVGGVVALVAAFFTAPFFVRPGWNSGQVRRLIRFGLPLAGASLLLLGVYNVDSRSSALRSAPPPWGCTPWPSTYPAGRPGPSPRRPAGFPSPDSPG